MTRGWLDPDPLLATSQPVGCSAAEDSSGVASRVLPRWCKTVRDGQQNLVPDPQDLRRKLKEIALNFART